MALTIIFVMVAYRKFPLIFIFENVACPISGIVVDDDHLLIDGKFRLINAFQNIAECCRFIVDRDDDGEFHFLLKKNAKSPAREKPCVTADHDSNHDAHLHQTALTQRSQTMKCEDGEEGCHYIIDRK